MYSTVEPKRVIPRMVSGAQHAPCGSTCTNRTTVDLLGAKYHVVVRTVVIIQVRYNPRFMLCINAARRE